MNLDLIILFGKCGLALLVAYLLSMILISVYFVLTMPPKTLYVGNYSCKEKILNFLNSKIFSYVELCTDFNVVAKDRIKYFENSISERKKDIDFLTITNESLHTKVQIQERKISELEKYNSELKQTIDFNLEMYIKAKENLLNTN